MVIARDVEPDDGRRGIVHSERTPRNSRGAPMSISGLQTWLALPDDKEVAPLFENTASTDASSTTQARPDASSLALSTDEIAGPRSVGNTLLTSGRSRVRAS